MNQETIRVIQIDQFTSTGDIRNQDFDAVTLSSISGGDSLAAKVIFGGSFAVKEVNLNDDPRIGYVWFIKGENGKCTLYKSNYDTSD